MAALRCASRSDLAQAHEEGEERGVTVEVEVVEVDDAECLASSCCLIVSLAATPTREVARAQPPYNRISA
jgi:hypothetical protein